MPYQILPNLNRNIRKGVMRVSWQNDMGRTSVEELGDQCKVVFVWIVTDTALTKWLVRGVTKFIDKIRLIESNTKCRYLKKLTCKGLCGICPRPPPMLGFCLGWSCNFVGSDSGQIQSIKLLQNMVYNTTLTPPPPPSVYNVLWLWEGRWTREKVRRTTVHENGLKIPTWLDCSSVYKLY